MGSKSKKGTILISKYNPVFKNEVIDKNSEEYKKNKLINSTKIITFLVTSPFVLCVGILIGNFLKG